MSSMPVWCLRNYNLLCFTDLKLQTVSPSTSGYKRFPLPFSLSLSLIPGHRTTQDIGCLDFFIHEWHPVT
eukprot:UN2332